VAVQGGPGSQPDRRDPPLWLLVVALGAVVSTPLKGEVDQLRGQFRPSASSALLWLLLAIADFSPREDDTGISCPKRSGHEHSTVSY